MQVEQGFTSFFVKFFEYLIIFQSIAAPLVHSTFEISSKIWQKMKKSLVQLALNPFLHGTSETWVSFGYPIDPALTLGLFLQDYLEFSKIV